MKGSDLPTSRSAYALRQAEGGTPVADVCRQLGVSEASFYSGRRSTRSSGCTGDPRAAAAAR